MTDKERYADIIVDSIGEIDDKYINEAQTYTRAFRMPGYVKAAIAMAASLLLIVGLMLPLAVIGGIGKRSGSAAPDKSSASYSTMMYDALKNTDREKYESVPDGGAALIWQTADNTYHTVPLDEKTAEIIYQSAEAPLRTGESDVKIWIRTSDGDYFSPELKRSRGNVDRTVFDYSPEISVDENTAKTILAVLKEDEK